MHRAIPQDVGDELSLPAHKRRTGRMESLHEFQQRALTYNDSRPPIPSELRLEITSTPSEPLTFSNESSQHTDDGWRRRLQMSRRSTTSLFGNARRTTKSAGKFYQHQLKVVGFLMLLGIIGGPLSYAIRSLYGQIFALRSYLFSLGSSRGLQFLLWSVHTVAFTQLALLWTRLSPAAAGSGISQMKSVLTGIDPQMYIPGYFDTKTLLAKLGGLVCAVGSGLIVGTEGAFVHIMSIITHHLLQIPMFRAFSSQVNARQQLLAAACAVGVASTFSSPIGGVLFSMEVTSTYYLMSNYMKAFISSVSGSLMLQVTLALANSSSRERGTSILKTLLPPEPFVMQEIPLFIILGVLVGILAVAMIALLRVVVGFRKTWRSSDNTVKLFCVTWVDPILVALFTAGATFWLGEFSRNRTIDDLSILFMDQDLPPSWTAISKMYSLSMLCVVQGLLLPLCITLRIPTGVWLPTFIAGASFGRLFGEILGSISATHSVVPGAYALAGAAAFAAASTGTVSAAVIALEVTGTMSLLLPVFCAVLAAIGVLHMSPEQTVYDTLMEASGLPYLPLLDFDHRLTAEDIVEPLLVFVTKRTTVAKLLLAVQRLPGKDIPVVHSENDMCLLGLVKSEQIKKLIRFYYQTNGLADVDVDLGDVEPSSTRISSWTTFVNRVSNATPPRGGFYSHASYDQIYHALATTPHAMQCHDPFRDDPGNGRVPFLMDDDKMLALLSEGWSNTKKKKLEQPIKLSHGRFCELRPMALTVSSATPLHDLHMIFTMLRCDHCYVCDQGSLVGVVTTQTLLRAEAIRLDAAQ